MGFKSPIPQKSRSIEAAVADIVYIFNRATGTLVEATGNFATDLPFENSLSTNLGVLLQNRTSGPAYLWYGPLPDSILTTNGDDPDTFTIDVTEFKAIAFKLAAGDTYEPYRMQNYALYILLDGVTGHLHHISY